MWESQNLPVTASEPVSGMVSASASAVLALVLAEGALLGGSLAARASRKVIPRVCWIPWGYLSW